LSLFFEFLEFIDIFADFSYETYSGATCFIAAFLVTTSDDFVSGTTLFEEVIGSSSLILTRL
jgi:hypothetical protein